jgi:sterol desaturase/sphingolipid hydroxylase (fatty acid hydroxylase superfamily)
MEILDYLLSIDINYIIIGFIAFFFTLEQIFSNQFKFTHRGKHLVNNLLIQLVISAVNVFFASVMVYAVEWLNINKIGLLHYIAIPFWVKLLLSVILFDFGTYWFHRISHRVPLIWQFHRVHHSDTSVDASTFLRFHPIDLVFWFGTGYIATSAIFGLELTGLGLYFLIATPIFFLEHTNLTEHWAWFLQLRTFIRYIMNRTSFIQIQIMQIYLSYGTVYSGHININLPSK